jgi:hypothetical protein
VVSVSRLINDLLYILVYSYSWYRPLHSQISSHYYENSYYVHSIHIYVNIQYFFKHH